MRATCGVNVLMTPHISGLVSGNAGRRTHKSYNRFMTSFSIPSIAFSNSASDALRHTSVSRIRVDMN